MFARFFLVKGFLKLDFLRDDITTIIQFINVMKKLLYMFISHRLIYIISPIY